jgi:hypothetical protein
MNTSLKPDWISKRANALRKLNECPEVEGYCIAVQGRTEMAWRLLPILMQTKLQVKKLQVVELGLSIERTASFEEYLDRCAIDRVQADLAERASLAMIKMLDEDRAGIGVVQWMPYDANHPFRSETFQAIADQLKIDYEDWRTGVMVVKSLKCPYPLGAIYDEGIIELAQSVADEILYCFARDISRYGVKEEAFTGEVVEVDTAFVDPKKAEDEAERRRQWGTAGLFMGGKPHG